MHWTGRNQYWRVPNLVLLAVSSWSLCGVPVVVIVLVVVVVVTVVFVLCFTVRGSTQEQHACDDALVQPLLIYGRASKIQKGIPCDGKNNAGMPNNSPAAMNQGRLSFEGMVLPQKLSGSLESSLLGTAQRLLTLHICVARMGAELWCSWASGLACGQCLE